MAKTTAISADEKRQAERLGRKTASEAASTLLEIANAIPGKNHHLAEAEFWKEIRAFAELNIG